MAPLYIPRCDHPTPACTIATTPQGRFFYVFSKLIAYEGRNLATFEPLAPVKPEERESVSVRLDIDESRGPAAIEMGVRNFFEVSASAFAAIIGFDGDPRFLTGDFR